jgi:hypothetical protein
MDWLPWIIAIPVGVAANFATDFIKAHFGIHGNIVLERRRSKALKEYRALRKFAESKWDINSYLILQTAFALAVLLIGTASLAIAGILMASTTIYTPDELRKIVVATILLSASYLFCAIVALNLLLGMRKTANRFYNMEGYRAELKSRFQIDAEALNGET